MNLSPEALIRKDPKLQRVADEYHRAKRDPAFPSAGQSRKETERRWRNIRIGEKLRESPELQQMHKLFAYTVRKLGDAHAHHRPSSLLMFTYRAKDGSLGVRNTRRPRDDLYSEDWVAFEASVCLLILCDLGVDKFFLGRKMERRVHKLFERLRALAATGKKVPGERRPRIPRAL